MINNDTIDVVLRAWNDNLKRSGFLYHIELNASVRTKKFFVSRENSYENKIAEIKLLRIVDEKDSKEKDLLLWRQEELFTKIKGEPEHKTIERYIDSLYRSFLYEMIGNFSLTCEKLITNRDYAEYDVVNDRLMPDPKFEGMVIKVRGDSKWYEKDNTFDVCTQRDNGFLVYTAHDIAKETGGLAMISGKDCEIIVKPRVKLDLIGV